MLVLCNIEDTAYGVYMEYNAHDIEDIAYGVYTEYNAHDIWHSADIDISTMHDIWHSADIEKKLEK